MRVVGNTSKLGRPITAMNRPQPIALAAFVLLATTACQRKAPDDTGRIDALERKASQAEARQHELEQQLADQRLAAEREAMEREQMQIEQSRAGLEALQGAAATAAADQLNRREEALAIREGQFERLQANLNDEQSGIDARAAQLSEREQELAGRDACDVPEDDAAAPAVGDYGTFYDSLAPYGTWFETPDYGYVWQPVVVADSSWRPYTRGRWACSDHGWTWVSDEPHGWATCHYGRWCLLRDHGWVWVPGSEWAPSWVAWRIGKQYVGWAPLPPESLAYHGHHWDTQVDQTLGIGPRWYAFVELRHMGARINPHCLPCDRNDLLYQETANVTHIYQNNHWIVSGGPGYREVCAAAGHALPFYRLDIDRHSRPGPDALAMRPRTDGGRLRIAAPNLDAPWNAAMRPARVTSRLAASTVDRPVTVRPEITERFHQSREENRATAEQAIRQPGGREPFNPQRPEPLDTNRRTADESARQTAITRESPSQGARNPGRDRQPGQSALTETPAHDTRAAEPVIPHEANDPRARTLGPQTGAAPPGEPARQQQVQLEENRRRGQVARQAEETQRLAAQQAEQARQLQLQQEANQRREQAARQAEETKRLAEQQAEQARQHQLQQEENQRRQQEARQAEDIRRQAEQQAEAARRQAEHQIQESRKQSDDDAKKGHGR